MRGTAKYRDRVVVTRGDSSGTQDPVTGVWTPGDDDTVILDSVANVQAGGLLMASRRATGAPQTEADGQFVVPPRMLSALLDLVPGDIAHIVYAPIRQGTRVVSRGADASVTFVRPEDRTALVKYL